MMEARVIGAERAEDCAKAVGVFHVEIRPRGQAFDGGSSGFWRGHRDLHGEPFVHHQPVPRPTRTKLGKFLIAFAIFQKDRQRAKAFGHIARPCKG